MLERSEARKFYDRFGAKQDWQIYEHRPIQRLIQAGKFEQANNVFEFGCGTGSLGLELMSNHLPKGAYYRGVDISATMVTLARRKLAPFGDRADVQQIEGEMRIDSADNTWDRVVCCYVLDLLSETDIRHFLLESHRVLKAEGLLCLVSFTHGITPVSRGVEKIWSAVFHRRPSLVGGCRPLALAALLEAEQANWKITSDEVLSSFGVASEVLVAQPVKLTS